MCASNDFQAFTGESLNLLIVGSPRSRIVLECAETFANAPSTSRAEILEDAFGVSEAGEKQYAILEVSLGIPVVIEVGRRLENECTSGRRE